MRQVQLEVLRRMTPEQRLKAALDLSEFTRALFREGLRHTFPDLSEEALHRLYLERMAKCWNKNY